MLRLPSRPASSAAVALAVLAVLATACGDKNVTNAVVPPNAYDQANLVADASGAGATTVDPSLVNSWGIAFGPTGSLWVSNNGSGTSTVYDASGNKSTIVVTIPGAGLLSAGTPTGVVFNTTSDFIIPGAGAASFIFAGEDGSISAWSGATGSAASLVADRSRNGSVYKGIAIASNAGANFLYLTDFHNGNIDVFDRNFAFVRSFTDSTMPAGYAPFGISNIGGQLFVTFAKQQAPDDHDDEPGVGNGYVDVFTPAGSMVRRFASNGRLNSPWAVVAAPASFGAFTGDILVGNFGDGLISAYDPSTGAFIDVLRGANGNAIMIDGLWGLAFGPSAGSTTLYFAAGPDDESHGLLGTLMVH